MTTDDDMTDVVEESSDNDSDMDTLSMQDVEVIAVPTFSSYTACITCHAMPKWNPSQLPLAAALSATCPSVLTNVLKHYLPRLWCKKHNAKNTASLYSSTGSDHRKSQIDVETLLTVPPCCIKYNQRQNITSVYWCA